MKVRFLSVDDVLAIHQNQLELYGGAPGIRDQDLLESAVAMPQQMFDGKYLHSDLVEMAAACWFHLVQNHPFHDGNKRVGLAAMLVFLFVNGRELVTDETELEEMTMALARSELDKPLLSDFLRPKVYP
ncbi:type II toxin-antitoxin system death-on-curing family toxin [bacterium]|nr:type II toxin-antitoxin system death-on-curing family toxin [bacterium]